MYFIDRFGRLNECYNNPVALWKYYSLSVITEYAYDAAGRLIQEGDKSYTYAWLDKLMSVSEAGKVSANFSYHPDGQIASVTYADGRHENYLWDGLALIHRNGTDILNEPAITGGNPVLSGDKVLFNDLLGNTLGVKDQSSYQPIRMTAFGESDNADAFFTGKPLVGELGYTFLFRNYRPEQGKWQTSDPLGYPDGWNNLAYVNNGVTMAIDWLGGEIILSDKSFNAATLFTSRFVPNSETPNWFVNQGNTNVSYYVTADIKKDKNGISVSNPKVNVDAQIFGIQYYKDNNNNGIFDAGDKVGNTLFSIRGSADISLDSSVTSEKNADGSTTYTLSMVLTVIERVNSDYGSFSQTQVYSLPNYTTHTVE